MEETTYLQHYRVCTDEQGTPEEVSRSGAAINYKAVDTRSGEAVMLQLIPLAAIDPGKREQLEQRAQALQKLDHVNIARVREVDVESERFIFISEYLQGETADSWVIAHGPLAADAVLRVALQVVRAIAAAAFHGLTHRAIQPANLMIVPGPAPEGGWPFVKLLNFGVAGVELHSASDETRELAPALPPQFASPEQLRRGEIDFRSEMYSLGATMCFLLAGAVPLAVGSASARARLRSLPELRRAPRRLRKLLAQMLAENPEMRPQDPVALEKEIQRCLGQRKPPQQVVRSLTPVAPVLPEKPLEGPAPVAQVWRGVLAVAALLLLGGVAAAFFNPSLLPWRHRGEIGKPVGVPERSTSSTTQPVNIAPAAAKSPGMAAASPSVAQTSTGQAEPAASSSEPPAASQSSDKTSTSTVASAAAAPSEPVGENAAAKTEEQQTPARAHAPAAASSAGATSALASNATQASEPAQQSDAAAPPAEAPQARSTSERSTGVTETNAAAASSSDEPKPTTVQRTDRSKKKSRVAKTTKTSRRGTIDPSLAAEEDEAIRRAGQVRARFVGTTSDGRLLLRLPSGEIVTVRPRPGDENLPVPRRPWRPIEEEAPRPDDEPRY